MVHISATHEASPPYKSPWSILLHSMLVTALAERISLRDLVPLSFCRADSRKRKIDSIFDSHFGRNHESRFVAHLYSHGHPQLSSSSNGRASYSLSRERESNSILVFSSYLRCPLLSSLTYPGELALGWLITKLEFVELKP